MLESMTPFCVRRATTRGDVAGGRSTAVRPVWGGCDQQNMVATLRERERTREPVASPALGNKVQGRLESLADVGRAMLCSFEGDRGSRKLNSSMNRGQVVSVDMVEFSLTQVNSSLHTRTARMEVRDKPGKGDTVGVGTGVIVFDAVPPDDMVSEEEGVVEGEGVPVGLVVGVDVPVLVGVGPLGAGAKPLYMAPAGAVMHGVYTDVSELKCHT